MPEIQTDAKGRRLFNYRGADGKRRTMRLGKMPLKQARVVAHRVEDLVAARAVDGVLDTETKRWLAAIGDDLAERLASHGLIDRRQAEPLGAFIDGFIARREATQKPATITNYKQVRRYLVDHFGEVHDLRKVRHADAQDWRAALEKRDLHDNTIRRAIGRARQFYAEAIARELADHNPFTGMSTAVQANHERMRMVGVPESEAVLAACPNAGWRALFGLARWGGLRNPSETGAVRWEGVDWGRGRFWVRSPKTEHHAGKEGRWVPIFPELLPLLREAFEEAEPGAELICPKAADPRSNLRTELRRIILRAGVTPWPKLWQNLRATRETELAAAHPIHVVTAWMGNSVTVAAKHYLQVADSDFDAATAPKSGGVMQGVMSQASAHARNDPREATKKAPKTLLSTSKGPLMPVTGVEAGAVNALRANSLDNHSPAGDATCDVAMSRTEMHMDANELIARLKIALADAIRRPMGVVPDSAEGLIKVSDLDAAEARRAGGAA